MKSLGSKPYFSSNNLFFSSFVEESLESDKNIRSDSAEDDVYTRLRLTSDPDISISTKIINGGGKYLVFNESLHLNVRTFDSSLKCDNFLGAK
ncbi:hypothetical protein KSP40_PGU018560 [Platanthera guangdongensis]|uniref:Uncharacterized protein n=1 Tax=Platanthera guangdongensis TaxID=2320717 RepID=A0ABR2LU49_9ASPA